MTTDSHVIHPVFFRGGDIGRLAVCGTVGIDGLHVANEGKAVLGVRAADADRVLALLWAHPLGLDAAIVGVCTEDHVGMVMLDTGFGRRLVAEPEGELLPRIC